MTIFPAAMSISAMIERFRALPKPPAIERRDEEEMLSMASCNEGRNGEIEGCRCP
jgi:hypothetical protein